MTPPTTATGTGTTTRSDPLDDDGRHRLTELAADLRVRAISMSAAAGSGHPTSSMSASDLIAVLASRHLRLDPDDPDRLGNDRLLFSKGHASPLLYALLDSMGAISGRIDGFDGVDDAYRRLDSILEGHPTPRVPGVPAATGSLGLGLVIGAGLATAHRLAGLDEPHVWVLCGDGELAEGAIWEAAEHLGTAKMPGITALLDVNRLGQTGPTRHGWDVDAYATRFGAFGWHTITIDGHDVDGIDEALAEARAHDGPTAIVARTVKGRGASETADENGKHGKPLDDPDAAIAELGGRRNLSIVPLAPDLVDGPPWAPADPDARADGPAGRSGTVELPRWDVGDSSATRDAFGAAIVAVGAARPDVVTLDGEVKNSTRLDDFADEFDGRFVQSYIAEQLMTGMAIGLQASGWRPVMVTFGAFLTRAADVLRMASISRADLTVVGSHAGVSIGEDGPSQMALEDVSMMRTLADSTVVCPSDANQTAALLPQLIDRPGISYLRTLRQETPVVHDAGTEFRIGGSIVLHEQDEPVATIIASGQSLHDALEAARRLDADDVAVQVLDAYSIKPLDEEAVLDAARSSGRLVVVEDHRREGGLGDAVASTLVRHGVAAGTGDTGMIHLAVDAVPASATPAEQRRCAGIDAAAIVDAVRS